MGGSHVGLVCANTRAPSMAAAGVVVIGASAGGVHALSRVAAGLSADFPGAVLVTMHTAASGPGLLPEILRQAGPLPAEHAQSGEHIEPGRIYVAPPDRHLIVEAAGRLRLSRGPKENHARPAVDPLFRSAALSFGPRAIGAILTGHLNDGSAGLRAIKLCGGIAVVQDPGDAEAPSMPASALRVVEPDYCLPLAEIAPLLTRLVSEAKRRPVHPEVAVSKDLEIEAGIAAEDQALLAHVTKLGEPSLFTCPECHGALLELNDKKPLRYRCHTGHAFTADTLLACVKGYSEDAVWNSIRALQEAAMLMRHMASHARNIGHSGFAEELVQEARTAQQRSDEIRNLHLKTGGIA